eukprot:Opistho-2@70053
MVAAIASASPSGSPGGASRPAPRWATSGTPPTRLATNGVPHADASRRTFGTPSDRLGSARSDAARNQTGSRSWAMTPWNRTRSPTPRSAAWRSRVGRSGPFPTTCRSKPTPRPASRAQASMRTSGPLHREEVADVQDRRPVGVEPELAAGLGAVAGAEDGGVHPVVDEVDPGRVGPEFADLPRQIPADRHHPVGPAQSLHRAAAAGGELVELEHVRPVDLEYHREPG